MKQIRFFKKSPNISGKFYVFSIILLFFSIILAFCLELPRILTLQNTKEDFFELKSYVDSIIEPIEKLELIKKYNQETFEKFESLSKYKTSLFKIVTQIAKFLPNRLRIIKLDYIKHINIGLEGECTCASIITNFLYNISEDQNFSNIRLVKIEKSRNSNLIFFKVKMEFKF